LGCENDYEAFQQELIPLLENIHGDTRHAGKIPRRRGISQKDLVTLRKRLQQAIQVEDYEAAAQLRDLIKQAEEGQA
jgi:protein arginine kinase activator